jgi:hypothetical protein
MTKYKDERHERIASFCRFIDNADRDIVIRDKDWLTIRDAVTNHPLKRF